MEIDKKIDNKKETVPSDICKLAKDLAHLIHRIDNQHRENIQKAKVKE